MLALTPNIAYGCSLKDEGENGEERRREQGEGQVWEERRV